MTLYSEWEGDDRPPFDDDWTPVDNFYRNKPRDLWDDPEEYFEYRRARRGVHYDFHEKKWVCKCERFEEVGVCSHMYMFRNQQTLNVDSRYL